MGIFSRFKDIMNANINALLDKADDPEKMIKLMIQEMEDTLVELRASATSKLAEQKKLQRSIQATKEAIHRWASRAQLAVEKDRDSLAREAISEKQALEQQLISLQEQAAHYDTLVAESKEQIAQIEEKLITVREKHRLLIQRARHAENSVRASKTLRESSGSKAFERFALLESRIERMEAEAELTGVTPSSLEREAMFRELESNQDIEDELARLKKLSGSVEVPGEATTTPHTGTAEDSGTDTTTEASQVSDDRLLETKEV